MAESNQQTDKMRMLLETSAKEDEDSRVENPLKLVPISAKKFEPMLVCSNQHKNRIPKPLYSALAELHLGEGGCPPLEMTEIFPSTSSEISAKEKTNRKKTKRKKRKSETTDLNKRVVILRMPSSLRYMDLYNPCVEMAMCWETVPIICPPYDLAATTLEAAYPLQKIISDDEWDCLLDVLDLSNAGEKVSFDVYPVFVCNRVHKLDNIKDEKEKRKLAGIFSFIAHLVRFNNFYEDKIPGKLFKRFSSLFTSKGRYRLIVLYILVLTLHADNFKTNLKDITTDLRCIKEVTKDWYRCLGCEVVEEEEKITLATLSLPLQLQFPRPVSMVEPDESRVCGMPSEG